MEWKFSGTGNSKQFLPDVKGLIVMVRGTTISAATIKTLAAFEAIIKPATTAAIKATYLDIKRGIDPKTTAPQFTTANTGFKEKTQDFAPEFTAYGHISWVDYRTWFDADGVEFDFIPVLADGNIQCAVNTAGDYVGFEGRLFVTFDLPKAGGDMKQKQSSFDVMFDDVEQYKNLVNVVTAFSMRDLEGLVPVGLSLEVVTNYTGGAGVGAVVVKATHRVTGAPYAGLTTTAEWEVVSVTADAAGAVTAVSATSFNSNVVRLKDTCLMKNSILLAVSIPMWCD